VVIGSTWPRKLHGQTTGKPVEAKQQVKATANSGKATVFSSKTPGTSPSVPPFKQRQAATRFNIKRLRLVLIFAGQACVLWISAGFTEALMVTLLSKNKAGWTHKTAQPPSPEKITADEAWGRKVLRQPFYHPIRTPSDDRTSSNRPHGANDHHANTTIQNVRTHNPG